MAHYSVPRWMRVVRIWLRRHDKLFTVIAALAVAAIFFIKEGKREDLHDLLQRAEAADSLTKIRQDLALINRELRALAARSMDQRNIGTVIVGESNHDLRQVIESEALDIELEVQLPSELLAIGHDEAVLVSRVKKADLDDIDRHAENLSNILNSAYSAENDASVQPHLSRKELIHIIDVLNDIKRKFSNEAPEALKTFDQTSSDLDSLTKKTERDYEFYNSALKYTFVVSSILALIGKLAGLRLPFEET